MLTERYTKWQAVKYKHYKDMFLVYLDDTCSTLSMLYLTSIVTYVIQNQITTSLLITDVLEGDTWSFKAVFVKRTELCQDTAQ